jgi:hypothetical protein
MLANSLSPLINGYQFGMSMPEKKPFNKLMPLKELS